MTDFYSSTLLTKVVNKRRPAITPVYDLFFRGKDVRNVPSAKVQIDIKYDYEGLASSVSIGAQSNKAIRTGWKSWVLNIPRFTEHDIVTVGELKEFRLPGSLTGQVPMMQLVNGKLDDIFARFDTTLEYMCITAMQEAGMLDGSGVQLADYGVAAATGVALSSSVNALTMFTEYGRAIRKQVGGNPKIHAACGGDAIDSILESTEADALLGGPMGEQILAEGAIAKIGGVFIHEIDSSYATVGTPTTKVDSIGSTTVIMAPEMGATQMVFGPCEMPGGLVMADKAVDTWQERDPAGWIMRGETNPLPVVTRPLAVKVLTVTTA